MHAEADGWLQDIASRQRRRRVLCMCPDRVRCNDDLRDIHGLGALYDGRCRDQLVQYFATPHSEGPQPADALPLLGGDSVRAAGDIEALHDAESRRNHRRCPAEPEAVVSKHCKIGIKGESPPPQNDMN